MNKIGKLKVVEIDDINLVPRYLFDQIDSREWDTDKIVKFVNETGTPDGLNVLVNEDGDIKGVLWLRFNFIEECIDILAFAIDKKYQFNGVIADGFKFVRRLQKQNNLHSIKMRTNRPKALSRYGFNTISYVMEVR